MPPEDDLGLGRCCPVYPGGGPGPCHDSGGGPAGYPSGHRSYLAISHGIIVLSRPARREGFRPPGARYIRDGGNFTRRRIDVRHGTGGGPEQR